MMDIVYIVKNSYFNADLMYSLRSVAKNVTGYRRIFISGYRPYFVQGVRLIPVPQVRTKYLNALYNVLAACRSPDVSDNFILFNDDFFAIQPVDLSEGLAWNRGALAENTKRFSQADRLTIWQQGLLDARELLKQMKIKRCVDYSLHLPMIINKRKFLEMLARPEVRAFLDADRPLLFRTIYGNLFPENKGRKMSDVKLPYGKDLTDAYASGEWLSVFDNVVGNRQYPKLNKFLSEMFPQKCRFEK